MLAIPDIAAAPRTFTTGAGNPLAARLALALAGPKGPIPSARADSPELHALRAQLQAWLDRMNAGAKFIKPRMRVSLHQAVTLEGKPDPKDETYTVWLGGADDENHIGSMWSLERTWPKIERQAPGLASTALHTLVHAGRHSFVLFTPQIAEEWACYLWWHGDINEAGVLEDYRADTDDPRAQPPDDLPTRAWFDRVLPPAVTRPANRLKGADLQRVARRRGLAGQIARQVIELQDECAASHRRRSKFTIESQDEDGLQGLAFAATLRWNTRDPMLRLFDDYANMAAECGGAESVFGWFVLDKASDLPRLLAELEHYFRIVRKIEQLIPLIARRWRP